MHQYLLEPNKHERRRHVEKLAQSLNVRLERSNRVKRAGYYDSVANYIFVGGTDWSFTRYAICLHELGHCAIKSVRTMTSTRLEIQQDEIAAWDWAMAQYQFNTEMRACRALALQSYGIVS